MNNYQVKQCRERDVERLVERFNFTEEKARWFFNSFYRLSGLEQRLLVMENDARYYTHNRLFIDCENERSMRWCKRLNDFLTKNNTPLRVRLSGGYAQVVIYDTKTTGIKEVFTYGHYYN